MIVGEMEQKSLSHFLAYNDILLIKIFKCNVNYGFFDIDTNSEDLGIKGLYT